MGKEPVILDGKKLSAVVREIVAESTEELVPKLGRKPGLAVLLIGDNPASNVYVNSKEKNAKEVGFNSIVDRRSSDISEDEVLDIIRDWNVDESIDGILVQLPLPKHIDEQKVIEAIDPDKDVDGFSPINMGRLILQQDGFQPCTPAGIMKILDYYEIETKGKHIVVIGRSNIVGKPIANMLFQKQDPGNATVTVCHTGTKDLEKHTIGADIIIAAMGVAEAITSDMVKDGAVVIDVGMNRVEDDTREKGYRLTGDVDLKNMKDKLYAYTPVPGGVGPMTIAMLLNNTYLSASRKTSD
ncbi:MAG: bifunctional methylenetetrahydrofolate dehydrogenase/methenyltetrahydrofolate cyclohydrolase FolD [Candidatus Kapaibacteriales bacterium]